MTTKKNDFFFLKASNSVLNKWFSGNISIYFIHVIALVLIYTLFLQFIGSTPNDLNYVRHLFKLSLNMDSWNPMIKALIHCKKSLDVSVYQEILIKDNIKFQYPPTSLLLFDIPERITGMSYFKIAKIYNALSWISIIFTVFFTAKILTVILKKYHFQTINKSASFIFVAILTMMFYPLIRSYYLGQIQTILTMLATLVLYLYLSDRKKLAGIFVGLICLVKPQLGLIFIWALIRKEWSMVISGGITIIAVLIPSIFLYGFDNHWDYLSALSFLSKYGEGNFPNQSVNGLMNRLLFNGNNLNWLSNSFPPFNPVVYFSTLFSSIILISSGLFWHFKNSKPNVIELSIMMLCTTMAAPIAWEHHYSILLPIFILLSPFILFYYKNKKWKILIFVSIFIVATQYLGIVNRDNIADSYFNFLQSYLYFSALAILIFLFSISKKMI